MWFRLLTLLAFLFYQCGCYGQGHIVPPQFNQICKIQQSGTITNLTMVHCQISRHDTQKWRLDTLRRWVMAPENNQSEARFSYTVNCDQSGGVVSLPWPVKCPGLVEMTVSNCNITDIHADFGDDSVVNIPHHLTKLAKINSVTVQSHVALFSMFQNVESITPGYDCLQDTTIEEIIHRNVSYEFSDTAGDGMGFLLQECYNGSFMDILMNSAENGAGSVDYDSLTCTEEELQRKLEQPPRIIRSLNLRCNYKNLRVLDESVSGAMSRYNIHFLGQYNKFPVLETVNYSHTSMDEIPEEFVDWTFTFDKIKILDISHNRISKFHFKPSFTTSVINDVYIDLQYNNITTLTLKDLNMLAEQQRANIDIRNNPIKCDCEMKDFLIAISKPSAFDGPLKKYEYIRNMKCHEPKDLEGRTLRSLTVDDLNCGIDWVPYFVVLAVVAVLILIIIILSFLYRREIRIILVMRFHIFIPQSMSHALDNKKYHAFVSYANEDEDYVLDDLCTQLERPDKTHALDQSTARLRTQQRKVLNRFKLCLHQRDFVPGLPIIENIIQSISQSRHTVIVVSRNFLNSHWAMEEFYQAYKQSIAERRRHLIIVILGDIPETEIAQFPTLKRCMKTFTYLKASDRLFYDRLAYSLSMDCKMTKEEKENISCDKEAIDRGSSSTDDSFKPWCARSTFFDSQYSLVPDTKDEKNPYISIRL